MPMPGCESLQLKRTSPPLTFIIGARSKRSMPLSPRFTSTMPESMHEQ